MIDTSGEGLYGYNFGLSLGGSKQDGKIAPEHVMSFEWDGPWIGETAVTDRWLECRDVFALVSDEYAWRRG